MANQRRSGGNQKITTPAYSEQGVIRAERVIENAYDLAVNERLFQDASIPADKIVGGGGGGGIPGATAYFVAKLNQTGSDNPVVTIIENTTGATVFNAFWNGTGEFEITFSTAIFDTDNVMFMNAGHDSPNGIIFDTVASGNTLSIYKYVVGVGADNGMSDTSLLIILF